MPAIIQTWNSRNCFSKSFSAFYFELTLRRDNPQALAFWEAQGFRIAHYLLRQYRDLQTGELFIGALSSDFANTA
jgi:ribosomal protein S18 acetylase RimI-like enzyme